MSYSSKAMQKARIMKKLIKVEGKPVKAWVNIAVEGAKVFMRQGERWVESKSEESPEKLATGPTRGIKVG